MKSWTALVGVLFAACNMSSPSCAEYQCRVGHPPGCGDAMNLARNALAFRHAHSVKTVRLALRGGSDTAIGNREYINVGNGSRCTSELYAWQGKLLQLLKKGGEASELLDVASGQTMWDEGTDRFLLDIILKESQRTNHIPSWLKPKIRICDAVSGKPIAPEFPPELHNAAQQKPSDAPNVRDAGRPTEEKQSIPHAPDRGREESHDGDRPPSIDTDLLTADPDLVEQVLLEMVPEEQRKQLYELYEQAIQAEQDDANSTSPTGAANNSNGDDELMTARDAATASELFRGLLGAVELNVMINGSDWRRRKQEMQQELGLRDGEVPPGLNAIGKAAMGIRDAGDLVSNDGEMRGQDFVLGSIFTQPVEPEDEGEEEEDLVEDADKDADATNNTQPEVDLEAEDREQQAEPDLSNWPVELLDPDALSTTLPPAGAEAEQEKKLELGADDVLASMVAREAAEKREGASSSESEAAPSPSPSEADGGAEEEDGQSAGATVSDEQEDAGEEEAGEEDDGDLEEGPEDAEGGSGNIWQALNLPPGSTESEILRAFERKMAKEDASRGRKSKARQEKAEPQRRMTLDNGFEVKGVEDEERQTVMFPNNWRKEPGEDAQWNEGRGMEDELGERDVTGRPKQWGVDPLADAEDGSEWNIKKALDFLDKHPVVDDDTGKPLPSLKVDKEGWLGGIDPDHPLLKPPTFVTRLCPDGLEPPRRQGTLGPIERDHRDDEPKAR